MQKDELADIESEHRAWLIAQLEAWPDRVDETRSTNIEYLMKQAAAALRALAGG